MHILFLVVVSSPQMLEQVLHSSQEAHLNISKLATEKKIVGTNLLTKYVFEGVKHRMYTKKIKFYIPVVANNLNPFSKSLESVLNLNFTLFPFDVKGEGISVPHFLIV